MVACKYFLQGTCKFGSRCHYEHQVPRNYNFTSFSGDNSPSVLRQPNFGNSQNTKNSISTGNVDVDTLVKSVINDMTGAEKGGQWLLSCYAPFKEKPAFPGFEDQSPEEIRFAFYEAKKNGGLDQYETQLKDLLHNSILKIKILQNPSQNIVAILQNIYNTPPSSSSGTYGENVLTQNTSSLNQPSSFNSNSTSSSPNIFGGGGTQSSSSNWFTNSSVPSNQNIFQSGINNIFATQNQTPVSNNIFASQQSKNVNNQSNNIFASITSQQSPSINQESPNIFNSATPVSPIQNQNLFNTQNIFAQTTNQQNHNIFAMQSESPTNPNQNIFSSQNQPQQKNVNLNAAPFSNSQIADHPTPSNYSASIFGSTNTSNPSMGPQLRQSMDETLYSKLEDLTDEERKWFDSNILDIMNIPDKPPTYEMCFKA